ncbi:hypothetical protein [Halothermothrix orenii]|nr:hypothetical protein [Halothermothrix orenii]
MKPYLVPEDLYQHKLAVILGRGKRLKKILQHYPTEKKFKQASIKEIASVLGIKNLECGIIKKLKKLDKTYDRLITFSSNKNWSKTPEAKKVMGIDTEYLKSNLDCIQYVTMEGFEVTSCGMIFTNNDLAHSVNPEEGIDYLREVIYDFEPEIIVGHNFNSDIKVMERAYGSPIPELYNFDDTMELMKRSNLANIIGGSSLNKAIKRVFKQDVIGLFSAYKDINLLVEYGIKDALFPLLIRYYTINGSLPAMSIGLKIQHLIKEKNREIINNDSFTINLEKVGG